MLVKRAFPLLLLMAVTLLLLWWRMPDFFAHGNSRFIEPWGDGYKTYYAAFYHIQHDSTYRHFEGMNYPYGEHVVPGDCQPLFSNPLKWLHAQGVDVETHQLALFHGFLLLGIVLSVVFLFLLFRRLGLPALYGGAMALGLTFMAPQLHRLPIHYGLAHPELLPLVFYLLLRWHERPDWRWSLAIGGVVWAYSLVHFYYFAILAFAIVGWVGVRWVARRDWSHTLAYIGHGAWMLLLPFAFFYAWMLYPDTVTDRNPVPWGFFAYRSKPAGILTDMAQPHWQWIDAHIVRVPVIDLEGWAYIGVMAMAFLLVVLYRAVTRHPFRALPAASVQEHYLRYLLVSGALILLFSQGLPFILPYGKKLLAHTGPLQQFRSIGRFAWVFYYAVNIAAVYYLYTWLGRQRGAAWKLAIPVLLLGVESYHLNMSKDFGLDIVENWEAGTRFTDLPVDYSRYQACVPIPYFNVGSDNFWKDQKGWIGQKSETMSLQTGLPLTAAMLTRTSLSQTLNQLQLVTEPYRRPRILDDFPSDKPLLLFWDKERVLEYGSTYLHLLRHAKLLYEKDWMQLYELPLESFEQRIADQVAAVRTEVDTLALRPDGWRTTQDDTPWLYQSFDAQRHPDAYLGAGMLDGHSAYWNRLLDTVWQADYTGALTVSFWQYVNADRSARTTLMWAEYDAQTGAELSRQSFVTHSQVIVFDGNGWGLVEFSVPRTQAGSRLELIVTNNDKATGSLWLDELLVRPAGQTVAQQRVDGIWWNNRWYEGVK